MMKSGCSNSSRRVRSGPNCGCNLKAVIRVSNTEKNPGRLFYGCPKLRIVERCQFFMWVDNEALVEESMNEVSMNEATSNVVSATFYDEDWRKIMLMKLNKMDYYMRRLTWALMGMCILLGFVVGLLLK